LHELTGALLLGTQASSPARHPPGASTATSRRDACGPSIRALELFEGATKGDPNDN